MGPLGVGELPAVAQASRDLFFFLTRGPEVGIAWRLSNVRARISALLLLHGLKVAATASAISTSRKKEEARKKRNSRYSCTHSSVNTQFLSTVCWTLSCLLGYWDMPKKADKGLPSWVHLGGGDRQGTKSRGST